MTYQSASYANALIKNAYEPDRDWYSNVLSQPLAKLESYFKAVRNIIEEFFKNMMIVSKQPPVIVTMVELTSNRKSKFTFDLELE